MKKLTDQHANYKTLVFDDVVNLVTFLYYRIFTPLTLIAAIDRIHFDEAELWSRLNEALEKGKIKVASSAQYGALFKMSWVCDEILKRLDKLVTDGVKSGFGGGGIGAARALGGGGERVGDETHRRRECSEDGFQGSSDVLRGGDCAC